MQIRGLASSCPSSRTHEDGRNTGLSAPSHREGNYQDRQYSLLAQLGEVEVRRPPGTRGETPGAQAWDKHAILLLHGLPQHTRVPSVTGELLQHLTCIFMPSRPSLWEERAQCCSTGTVGAQEASQEPWCAVPDGTHSALTRDSQGSWKHAPEKLGSPSLPRTSEPAC